MAFRGRGKGRCSAPASGFCPCSCALRTARTVDARVSSNCARPRKHAPSGKMLVCKLREAQPGVNSDKETVHSFPEEALGDQQDTGLLHARRFSSYSKL